MFGFVPRPAHAVLDYLYGVAALATPKICGFEDDPKASLMFKADGAATIAMSLLTDYELGLIKKIPFNTHLMLDLGGGLLGLASPWLLGFAANKKARNAALAFALFELAAVAMSKRDETPYSELQDADF